VFLLGEPGREIGHDAGHRRGNLRARGDAARSHCCGMEFVGTGIGGLLDTSIASVVLPVTFSPT